MSFNVVLQTSASEKNKLDKSITDVATVSGVLKENTSIVNPVIRIKADLSSYPTCNYMTISDFGRSYFVTDIKSINGGFVEISGHCDVLSTYKTQILTNHAIISRSERNWNLYLNDGSLHVYQYPDVYTKPFPYAVGGGETFVLAIAGS